MKQFTATTLLIFCLLPNTLSAQEIEAVKDSSKYETGTLYKALAFTGAYYAASIYVMNKTWYKDAEKVRFHFSNDNAGYLQVDKFGHMFGSYAYSYIGYHSFLKYGASRNTALLYGSTLGFVMQFPIEIMDGIHEGYGFSWGDILEEFRLQYSKDGQWQDMAGGIITDNLDTEKNIEINPFITTDKIRIVSLSDENFVIREIEIIGGKEL